MTSATLEHVAVPAASRGFYVWMAAACLLITLGGFAPTYWLPLASGTLHKPPIVHFHGAAFFAWTGLFLVQASLAPRGQMTWHRGLGGIGAALAVTMVILGMLAQTYSLRRGLAAGFAERAELISLVSISDLLIFATLVVVALTNVRRTDLHKRLMVLATVSLLGAPVLRLVRTFIYSGPPGPPLASVVLAGTLAADALILVALLHDWHTRGRPHPAYALGGTAVIVLHLVRMPIGESQTWHRLQTAFLQ
jgi:hypothetical protein